MPRNSLDHLALRLSHRSSLIIMSNYLGEERVLTLYVSLKIARYSHLLTLHSFADVHYYFGAPNPRPLHHRFDKGSYVYLYRDPSKGRGRLEIANNPGSPEQDAFTGCKRRLGQTREILVRLTYIYSHGLGSSSLLS